MDVKVVLRITYISQKLLQSIECCNWNFLESIYSSGSQPFRYQRAPTHEIPQMLKLKWVVNPNIMINLIVLEHLRLVSRTREPLNWSVFRHLFPTEETFARFKILVKVHSSSYYSQHSCWCRRPLNTKTSSPLLPSQNQNINSEFHRIGGTISGSKLGGTGCLGMELKVDYFCLTGR